MVAIFIGSIVIIVALLIAHLISSLGRYASYWNNQRTLQSPTDAVQYVALGDSTAQAIGATSPTRGYVGILARRLQDKAGKPVHITNLGVSGAKIKDLIATQLPLLASAHADVITLEIGANDIKGFNEKQFRADADELFSKLPKKTIVSDLPFFGGRTRLPILGSSEAEKNVETGNTIFAEMATKYGFKLVPLHAYTKARNQYPWSYAVDYFHPSNLGYAAWADAFWTELSK